MRKLVCLETSKQLSN